jgi:alkylated DNA repair dioxygenase AlkB
MMLPTDVGTVTLVTEFLSPAEEQALLAHIEADLPAVHKRRHARIRNFIRRWGSSVPYPNDVVSATIPPHLATLCERLVEQKLVAQLPDSVTLNQYLKGQIIGPHIDRPDGGAVITVLSLATPATMVFTYDARIFSVELPPRSLVQLRDEIRYNWKHEIRPVADTRYSLVFRCSQECQHESV